jgi:hypothetical protein
MSEQLDVNYPGIEFYERDDVPFAFNPILYKCYWIYSDGSLKESPINLAELYINGRQITKAEALRLAKACGR